MKSANNMLLGFKQMQNFCRDGPVPSRGCGEKGSHPESVLSYGAGRMPPHKRGPSIQTVDEPVHGGHVGISRWQEHSPSGKQYQNTRSMSGHKVVKQDEIM